MSKRKSKDVLEIANKQEKGRAVVLAYSRILSNIQIL